MNKEESGEHEDSEADDAFYQRLWETFHLSDGDVAFYAGGNCSPKVRKRVEEHITWCETCRQAIEEVREYLRRNPRDQEKDRLLAEKIVEHDRRVLDAIKKQRKQLDGVEWVDEHPYVALALYIDGNRDPDIVREAEGHMLKCARCKSQVEAKLRMLRDEEE